MAIPRGFAKLHLIPVLISLALTGAAVVFLPLNKVIFAENKVVPPDTKEQNVKGFFSNFKVSANAETLFREALADCTTIVFLGSSEFASTELQAIPYNFFNSYIDYPVLCIGHAGNQSLNMLSFLAANRKYFNKSKLAILVSPGWFVSRAARGTSLESFLEFNSDRFLFSLATDPLLPVSSKEYIGDFIARNIDDISSPSPVQKLIAYQSASTKNLISGIVNAPFVFYYKLLLRTDTLIRKLPGIPHQPSAFPITTDKHAGKSCPTMDEIPWDSLYQAGLTEDLKRTANNRWGIDSAYYKDYVWNQQYRLLTVPFVFNREYRDFCALMDFLSTVDCKPVIIIQPMNPYVYENLAEVQPIIDKIADVVSAHHFPCLNLFVQDTASYSVGDLKDVMHLGNPGWYKVDHFVFGSYFSANSGKIPVTLKQ
jgi:poly-D-alanine transfer protein DltD